MSVIRRYVRYQAISIQKLLFVLIHRIIALFKETIKRYVLHPDFRWFIRNLLRKKRTFHNRSVTSGVGLIYLLFYDMPALWFWMQSDMQFMISFLIWNSNPVFYNYQTVVICWTVRDHMLHAYVYLYVKSLFMVWSYLLDEITPCYEFIHFNVNLKCKIMFLFYFIPRLVVYLFVNDASC